MCFNRFLFAFCLILGGIVSVGGGAVLIFESFAGGLATIGFGLIVTGIGLISSYAFFCFSRWLIGRLLQVFGRIAKGGKKA